MMVMKHRSCGKTLAALGFLVSLALSGCGKSEKQIAAERQNWMDRCALAGFTPPQCTLLGQINDTAKQASDNADDASSMAAIAQVRSSFK